MAEKCPFVTNDKNAMRNHLEDHYKMTQMLDKNKEMNLNLLENDERMRSCIYGWENCAYCNYTAIKPECLVDHVFTHHSKSIFQCSECFYRTIDIGMFPHHFNLAHSNDNNKTILLCGLIPDISVNNIYMNFCMNRERFIKKFVCANGEHDH